jgi:hypothetical protein
VDAAAFDRTIGVRLRLTDRASRERGDHEQ